MADEYDWYKYDGAREKSTLAKKLSDTAHCIDSAQSSRRALDARNLRLYSDREYRSKLGKDRRAVAEQRLRDLKRPGAPLNLIRNGVNAAVSMVCRGRPMPFFVTDASDWKLQRQTRKRHRFVNGILHREQHQLMGQSMAQQGTIFGTGAMQVLRTKHGPKLESVFTPELLVDEAEGQYGCPPNIYRVRSIDRDVLIASIPDAKDAIKRAPASTISGSGSTSNMVDIIWGWHMATDKEEGLEACCIDGGEYLLFAKPYKHKSPPFIDWRWCEEPLGWHGTGIPSEGAAIQFVVNSLLMMIDHNVWSGGNLKVLVERGAKIIKSHLNNDLRAPIIEYTGTPPQFSIPQTVGGDVMELVKWYASQFYQNLGISELNATSMTPAASMSGKARLVHENSESQRFLTTQRRYDNAMTIDTAERILEAAQDCFETYGDIEVMYSGSRSIEPVKYSDIIGPRESFDIEVFSASGLSNSVMGRFDEVQTYAQAGYYSQDEVMRLLDLPSTGAAADERRAIFENIECRLGKIVDEGIYIPPDDTLPLQQALKRANLWLCRAEVMSYNPKLENRIPDDHLDMLREWRDDVVNLIQIQSQPPAPTADASGNPDVAAANANPIAGQSAMLPAQSSPIAA